MVKLKTLKLPARRPGSESGRTTRQKVCHQFAPRSDAASSNEFGMRSRMVYSGRIMNGSQTWQNVMYIPVLEYRKAETGSLTTPVVSRNEFKIPLVPRIVFQAKARTRYELHSGKTTRMRRSSRCLVAR